MGDSQDHVLLFPHYDRGRGSDILHLKHLRHNTHSMGYCLHRHSWTRFRHLFPPSSRKSLGEKFIGTVNKRAQSTAQGAPTARPEGRLRVFYIKIHAHKRACFLLLLRKLMRNYQEPVLGFPTTRLTTPPSRKKPVQAWHQPRQALWWCTKYGNRTTTAAARSAAHIPINLPHTDSREYYRTARIFRCLFISAF
jgi:hypothetical protein